MLTIGVILQSITPLPMGWLPHCRLPDRWSRTARGLPATRGRHRRCKRSHIDEWLETVKDRGQGNLYFWDAGNLRIRKVDTDGIITTVAGTGERGSSPDGTPASEASLGDPTDHGPIGLDFDPAGRLHITDLGNSRIWMIDGEGRLRAVAGSGESAYSGDGGPATEAGLNAPLDIAFGPDGSLYIATHTHASEGHRVRMVDRDGIITTIAGTETAGYSGDGGPATEAELNIPAAVAFGPDGNLYIADGANRVIRMVAQ